MLESNASDSSARQARCQQNGALTKVALGRSPLLRLVLGPLFRLVLGQVMTQADCVGPPTNSRPAGGPRLPDRRLGESRGRGDAQVSLYPSFPQTLLPVF